MKFGTDGVRGVAGTDLTASFALDLGRAAARVLGGGEAVVGGDTRRSTAMLEAALVAGLASEGIVVHRLGVVPTPAVAFAAARRSCLGAMVSASHNEYRDNGIKLFDRGGTKLPDAVEARIEADVVDLPAPSAEPAQLVDLGDSAAYERHVLDTLAGRSLDGLRIVVDAANGAASRLAGPVLRATGAEVVVIHDAPDGRNINDGCGATHTASLAAAVVANGGDLGLALDGDADRLLAVDASGALVDGDHIIAICALDLHERGELAHGTVVVTVMTNLGFHLAMETAGIKVVETAVGDRYVLEALDAGRYSLGGEQSGHVIFRHRETTGDGLVTGLALADAVKRSGTTLAELAAAAMTRLPQVLVNVPVSARMPDAATRVRSEIRAAEADLGGRGRVLVRPSGTEPLVRVMVEAPTHEQAQATADSLAGAVRHAAS
ncbi:MAG: phosphoglucosamine mutase [Ilumatobacteraceae bacterium]